MATKKQIIELIRNIKVLQDELDETLTDRFADLEMALDELQLKENPDIFRVWDRLSDRTYQINGDFKALIKMLTYHAKASK